MVINGSEESSRTKVKIAELLNQIAVMEAFLAGKKIQFRTVGSPIWYTADEPRWSWQQYEYRVAPEKMYVLVYKSGLKSGWAVHPNVWDEEKKQAYLDAYPDAKFVEFEPENDNG